MKNTLQKSLMIAIFYYSIILIGCIKNQCNCAPVKNGKFNYSELRAQNLAFNFKADSTFSTNISIADTIEKAKYGIRMQLEYKILASTKRGKGFFNSAYACDCATSQFFIVDSVKSVSIITLNNLDASHPTGSEVKDYFKALQQQYSPNSIRYYDDLNPSHYNGPAYPSTTGIDQIDLYLKTAVSANQEVAFEITFNFASGKKLSSKTKPVFLK